MNFKKILVLIILCYFLTLLQTSFLVHFNIWGMVLNFVLLLIIIWNFFEKEQGLTGLFCALIGGLFLDIFSSRFIGFNVLILLGVAIFIKLIIKRHVRIPLIERV